MPRRPTCQGQLDRGRPWGLAVRLSLQALPPRRSLRGVIWLLQMACRAWAEMPQAASQAWAERPQVASQARAEMPPQVASQAWAEILTLWLAQPRPRMHSPRLLDMVRQRPEVAQQPWVEMALPAGSTLRRGEIQLRPQAFHGCSSALQHCVLATAVEVPHTQRHPLPPAQRTCQETTTLHTQARPRALALMMTRAWAAPASTDHSVWKRPFWKVLVAELWQRQRKHCRLSKAARAS